MKRKKLLFSVKLTLTSPLPRRHSFSDIAVILFFIRLQYKQGTRIHRGFFCSICREFPTACHILTALETSFTRLRLICVELSGKVSLVRDQNSWVVESGRCVPPRIPQSITHGISQNMYNSVYPKYTAMCNAWCTAEDTAMYNSWCISTVYTAKYAATCTAM